MQRGHQPQSGTSAPTNPPPRGSAGRRTVDLAFNVTTDNDCVQKILHALPFMTPDAGLAETSALIVKLQSERSALHRALTSCAEARKTGRYEALVAAMEGAENLLEDLRK